MSWATCYSGSNNIHFDYPPLMNDGRAYAGFLQDSVVNEKILQQNNIETTTPSPPTNTNATATVVPTEAEKTDDGVEKLPKTNVIVDGTGNKVVVGEV